MADIDEKTPLNVPGKFYVDSSCIDCDLCRETAPETLDGMTTKEYPMSRSSRITTKS